MYDKQIRRRRALLLLLVAVSLLLLTAYSQQDLVDRAISYIASAKQVALLGQGPARQAEEGGAGAAGPKRSA